MFAFVQAVARQATAVAAAANTDGLPVR
jgi:hypothetical protein